MNLIFNRKTSGIIFCHFICDEKYILIELSISRMSSNGLCSYNGNLGYHEFSVKILKSDVQTQNSECFQEIGVISDLKSAKNVQFKNGIQRAFALGSRSIFGTKSTRAKYFNYYTSIDDNNTTRCYKNLSKTSREKPKQWQTDDVIRVCVNLKKYNIKFYLNGKQVRKTLSLQQNKTYYPVIAFTGDCQYELIDFK